MTLAVRNVSRTLGCVALLSGALFAVSGCASLKKAPKEQAKPVVFREFTLKDLRDDLAGRQKLITNLSGNVSAELSNRAVPSGKQSLTGQFAFEMPNRIWMSLSKPMTKFQVDLISDGDRFWLVNHSQKTVQTGKCENLVGVENEKLPFRPMDLVDAYFLREVTEQPGFTKRITFLETIGNYYIISVLRDDFSNLLYSKIWVDRFNATVVRHQLYDSEKGLVRVDAVLGGYESVGEVSVAHRMTVSWPNQLSSLELEFRGLRVNQKWENSKIFIFDNTKPDYGFLDIDQTQKAEQTFGLRERQPGAAPAPGYPPSPGGTGFPPGQPPGYPPSPQGGVPSTDKGPPAQPLEGYVPPPNPYDTKKSKLKPPE